MNYGEIVGWIVLVLLALYGCAQLIRRLCLWVFRCPDCAVCCRLAVPRNRAALAPLIRCLQSQTVWEDPVGCRQTLLLLPGEIDESQQEMETILRECPSVIPVTAEGLQEMLQLLTKE